MLTCRRPTVVVAAAVAWCAFAVAATAHADPPDAVWNALKDMDVVLTLSDGSTIGGKLIGVEPDSVVVMSSSGEPVAVKRASVDSVRGKPSGDKPSGDKPSGEDPGAKSPANVKKRAKLKQFLNRQVVVVTVDGNEVVGKLVELGDEITLLHDDETVEKLAVDDLKNVRARFSSADGEDEPRRPPPRRSGYSGPSAAEKPPTHDGPAELGGDAWAARYAAGSAALTSSGDLYSFQVSGVVAGSGGVAGLLGLGATPRFVVGHFLIQPSLAFGVVAAGDLTPFVVEAGLGVGGAVAVSRVVALSPMARVMALVFPKAGALVAPMAELPITVFAGSNGFVEPYVDVGAVVFTGDGFTGEAAFLFGVGYRLGVVF